MKRAALLTTVLCLLAGSATAQNDWPKFRGPNGTGYVAEATPPTEWSETTNVRWKVPVPGESHSSPIVVGDRVYVMTAVDTGQPGPNPPTQGRRGEVGPTNILSYHVIAYNRADGAVVWNTTVTKEQPAEGTHPTSEHASGSVVVQDGAIYAFFGSPGLFKLDTDGRVLWSTDFGQMSIVAQFGEAASVGVHGDTVVVPWDHQGDSFVFAVDAKTGKEKWRRPRNEQTNWATPAIAVVNGKPQAILPGRSACIAYDLATGQTVWESRGLTPNCIPTPIVENGIAYLTSGYQGRAFLAVDLAKATGKIDGTPALLWEYQGRGGTPYVPSPLLAGGQLYFLNNYQGILTSIAAATGEVNYQGERLDSINQVYASIVGANDRYYIASREGNTTVFEVGPSFKPLRTNTISEGINGTPAISNNEIFIRGSQHLYCIANPAD